MVLVKRCSLSARLLINNQDCVNRCGIEPIMKLQVSTKCKHLNKFVVSKYPVQGKC